MKKKLTTLPQSAASRRSFLAAGAAGSVLAASSVSLARNQPGGQESAEKFKLKFAPHPGTFRALAGDDIIEQIKFASAEGFTALEFNGLPGQSVEMQERIGQALADHDMTMGVFVGYANFVEPTFASPSSDQEQQIIDSMKRSVEIAKRVNAKWFTVVPGSIDQQAPVKDGNRYGKALLAPGYQMANVVTMLRKCCAVLEPAGLTMVLEPLNWHVDHGGTYLRYSDHAYAVCKAVNSPSCKILFDIYHQQITEGNLINNIDRCWDEIGYFQSGDNPGRNEPGTGEINYRNVFQHIYDRSKREGREFVIGMEHGASRGGKEGEQAVIEAYRGVNPTAK